MKALIIDAGNSRVSCAAWQGSHQLPGLVPGSSDRLASPVPLDELGSFNHPSGGPDAKGLGAFFSRIYEEAGHPAVVLVSVVAGFAELLPNEPGPEIIDHNCELPFVLDVSEPARVGPDRLCNMASAVAAGLSSALVVDAGTATTFDLLIDGVFVGGMIAPGMAFAARQLGQAASRLSPVPFGPVSWDVGRDTGSAMAAGAWHAGVGGIRSVVTGLLGHYGDLPVVVTGGLGEHLKDQEWFFDPHWTLRGAAFLSKTESELT